MTHIEQSKIFTLPSDEKRCAAGELTEQLPHSISLPFSSTVSSK